MSGYDTIALATVVIASKTYTYVALAAAYPLVYQFNGQDWSNSLEFRN